MTTAIRNRHRNQSRGIARVTYSGSLRGESGMEKVNPSWMCHRVGVTDFRSCKLFISKEISLFYINKSRCHTHSRARRARTRERGVTGFCDGFPIHDLLPVAARPQGGCKKEGGLTLRTTAGRFDAPTHGRRSDARIHVPALDARLDVPALDAGTHVARLDAQIDVAALDAGTHVARLDARSDGVALGRTSQTVNKRAASRGTRGKRSRERKASPLMGRERRVRMPTDDAECSDAEGRRDEGCEESGQGNERDLASWTRRGRFGRRSTMRNVRTPNGDAMREARKAVEETKGVLPRERGTEGSDDGSTLPRTLQRFTLKSTPKRLALESTSHGFTLKSTAQRFTLKSTSQRFTLQRTRRAMDERTTIQQQSQRDMSVCSIVRFSNQWFLPGPS